MAKLTKKQTEAFERFTKGIVANTILLAAADQGMPVTDEIVEHIKSIVTDVDTKELSTKVGTQMLEKVSFAEFQKVEKFLLLEDTVRVMNAANEVGFAIREEVVAIVADLFGKATE